MARQAVTAQVRRSLFFSLGSAASYGIKPYSALRRQLVGSSLQAHHLIERRFAKILGVSDGEMLSIAVTRGEHQVFTNAWRARIPYGAGTRNATAAAVEEAAREIYSEFPEILSALGL